ncbi:hypothetical protein ZYGR_0S01810 [Zygosaccharomyces rouxii]|uniref:ZYRO0F06512p n=2 Tax=Zygosaccharomyces rouxii TaxID=4956 RepID=C5DXN7_ZYGRC|nr:uncharacterized protein ZYRO0F06512g [Zygosaccharomyces rouxii]KAH9199308.1 hypothetical protein LQ764DRAFT_128765 [Zygosaccharomyces rouxii]GAV50047.1 hypothetical protein ZYGR_0S01810 [Zygosaccharomyces rouxii]CAR28548.1 ZYRO0F06512p [Zygosaccharomyces rouxii]
MISMARVQIILTNVDKKLFKQGWPRDLESELFSTKFPQLKPQLSYFSPLPFLNRIVIIFADEASASQVYNYLVENHPDDVKVYLSESLLSQRSNSENDTDRISRSKNGAGERPILSLNTAQEANVSSPTLSPDRTGSPTLLRFDDNSEFHLYQEPLPKNQKQPLQVGTKCLWQDQGQPMSPSITLDEFTH